MVESGASISVLFRPEVVIVVDIFRALSAFGDRYELADLQYLERRLTAVLDADMARAIVSDALLLEFGLRRERSSRLNYGLPGSRQGTVDEYRLLALLAATSSHDFDLTAAAAASLGIVHAKPLISLASDIAARLVSVGIRLDAPNRRLLRPVDSVATPTALEILMRDREAEQRRH